jgi:hypothetical protein
LERVKGIEPSSSAWKVVRKLNDINELCVKWQLKNRLKLPIFATDNAVGGPDESAAKTAITKHSSAIMVR